MLLALAGMVLAACGLMRVAGKMMFGPLDPPENRGLIDLNVRELVVVLSLVLAILWVGLYPNPILRRVEPSVSVLLNAMARSTDESSFPASATGLVSRSAEALGARP